MTARVRRHLLVIAPRGEPSELADPGFAEALRQAGAEVQVLADDGYAALRDALTGTGKSATTPPDAVLLELPETSDLLPAQYIRQIEWAELGGRTRPLLALIRERHLTMPELPTLVDDFLLPPYRLREMIARLALIQNRRGTAMSRLVQVGEIEIDVADREVRVAGSSEPVQLTPREYDLLAFMAIHRGKVFTRKLLLEHVWGRTYDGGPRTVDIHIRRLREKLPSPHGDWIETVRHVGYRMEEARARRFP